MALTEQETARLVREAAATLQKGDLAAAHAIAERGIDAGSEHPFLLKVKALWLHNNGQYQEALRAFHFARTLTPDDPSILGGIAGCLAGMGEYDAALKIVDAALKLAPYDAATHFLRGWIHEAAGNLPLARESYERILSLSPRNVPALAGLASVAARLNDFTAARVRAAEALALDPRQATATIALAMAEVAQGEATAAESRIRNLLQIDLPSRARGVAWGVLADALDAQGRTEEALDARREKDGELRRGTAAAEKSDEPKS